jgi:hypothetical protein
MTAIELICLVLGDIPSKGAIIEVDLTDRVDKLRDRIYQKHQGRFRKLDLDPCRLKLYKLNNLPSITDESLLKETIETLDYRNSAQELLFYQEINEFWAEQPPRNEVHVLVEVEQFGESKS